MAARAFGKGSSKKRGLCLEAAGFNLRKETQFPRKGLKEAEACGKERRGEGRERKRASE